MKRNSVFSLFSTLLFLFFLELRLLVYGESLWPLAAALAWAFVSVWYLSRSGGMAVLAALSAALAAVFLLFSSDRAILQVIIFVFSFSFFLFTLFIRLRKPLGIAVISFVHLLAFFLFLFSYQASSHLSLWLTLPLVWVVSGILFFNSMNVVIELGFWLKVRLASLSLVVGFLMAEFYFVLSKLPFHVINIDFMLFLIYYTLWDIGYRYFSLSFTKRALLSDLGVLFLGLAIILFSSQWFPD